MSFRALGYTIASTSMSPATRPSSSYRTRLHFPPAVRMVAFTGRPEAVADLLATVSLPPVVEVLGPLPYDERPYDERPRGEPTVRALVRSPLALGADLVAAIKAGQAVRSARKAPDYVTVHVDPVEIG